MKIRCFQFRNMRNAEHVGFMGKVIDLLIRFTTVKNKFISVFDVFSTNYEAEKTAYKKERANVKTGQLAELDKERDRVYMAAKKIYLANLGHWNEEIRNAAKQLKVAFDTYGKVPLKSYNAQTAAMEKFVKDMNKDRYKGAIALMRLKEYIDVMNELNNRFKDLMADRTEEDSSTSHIKMAPARRLVDQSYAELTKKIAASVLLEGPADYEAFITELNMVVWKYKNTMAVRSGKLKAKKLRESVSA